MLESQGSRDAIVYTQATTTKTEWKTFISVILENTLLTVSLCFCSNATPYPRQTLSDFNHQRGFCLCFELLQIDSYGTILCQTVFTQEGFEGPPMLLHSFSFIAE